MADEVMFEVNAGQILAKLHLGCKEMFKKVTFYNSGIVGKDDGTPQNPGKCTFDLKNIKGQYEIACELEEYHVLKTLTNEQILLLLGKAIKPEGDDDKKYEKDKQLLEETLKTYLPSNEKTFNGQMLGSAKVYEDWIKTFAKPLLQQAFKYLQDYLTNFCGKENASKLTEEQLVPFFIDSPFSYKYDKYVIPESKNVDSFNKKAEEFDKKFAKEAENAGKNITEIKKFVDTKLPKVITENPLDLKGLKFKRAYKIGYKVDLEIA